MKTIIILGSTGSIGQQTLDIIGKGLKVLGLSAHTNEKLLKQQARKFNVKWTTLDDSSRKRSDPRASINSRFAKQNTTPSALAAKKCDIVVNAISGLAGLEPTLSALRAGNRIALANKESIVADGARIMKLAKPGQIIPVDSEHSSIYRCLEGHDPKTISKIILTCSGGPFFGKKKSQLKNVTAAQALAHPTWAMGKKISIDSATLMNKGFEIIEAHHLFGIPYERIEVLVHPQSLVHGMVQFEDGSIIAHASPPDMRIPIAYALDRGGNRKKNHHNCKLQVASCKLKKLDLTKQALKFHKPDHNTFEGIKIALKYAAHGKKLVQANDEAVEKFLTGKIKFLDIYDHIKRQMSHK